MTMTEERFRLLAERSPDVIYRVRLAPSLAVEYVSPAVETLTGYTPAEFYADVRLWLTLVHPDDRDLVGFPPPVDAPTREPVILRWVRKDGSITRAEHRSVPVLDPDGTLVAIEGSARDVTEQFDLMERLATSEARFRDFLGTIDAGALMLDRSGRVEFINDHLLGLVGRRRTDVLGKDWISIATPEDERQGVRDAFVAAIKTGTLTPTREDGVVSRTGVVRRLSWVSSIQRDRKGGITGLATIGYDVSDARRFEAERALLAAAIEQSAESVLITDKDALITYVNAAFERLSGYASAEVLGRNPRFLKSGAQSPTFYDAMWAAIANGLPWVADLTNRHKDGSLYHLTAVISPIRSTDGSITGFVSVGRDVSRERELETRTEALTRERGLIGDTLRRLPSGGTIETTAELFCQQVSSLTDIVAAALLIFESDGSAIPIAYVTREGGEVGLHRHTIERSRYLREHAEAGPWVELWRPGPEHPYAQNLSTVGVQAFAYAPILFEGSMIGILAVGSAEDDAVAQLSGQLGAIVDFADLAGALLGHRVGDRREDRRVRSSIEGIIAGRAFTPVFQPIVDHIRGQTVGHEALTRFDDGTRPDVRFADAVRVGMGLQLELVTLQTAFEAASALSPSRWLHVNVSPEFVLERTELRRLLTASHSRVVLEVTEHAVVRDYAEFRAAIESTGCPVRLAVDDAGAGFSSLRHILELRPAFVKLDISLVRGIDADPAKQALVAGMRFFARMTNRRLIAEGVETEAEAAMLRSLEIRLAQGYLFGRPAALPARL